MKNYLLLLTICSLLAACSSSNVVHRHDNEKEWALNKKIVPVKPAPPVVRDDKYIRDSIEREENRPLTHADSFIYKNHYIIGVVLPFAIDSNRLLFDSAENKIGSKKSIAALEFYEGVLIALDSLKRTGYHLTIKVVDFTEHGVEFSKIAKDKGLIACDLIIGTLNSNEAKLVNQYTSIHKIPFVSPMATSFLPEAPSRYISINPGPKQVISKMANFVEKASKENNIVIIHPNTIADNALALQYENGFWEKFNMVTNVVLSKKDLADTLNGFLSEKASNWIIVASNDNGYALTAARAISTLATEERKLNLIGPSSWGAFDALKTALSDNVTAYYATNSYINKNDNGYKSFYNKFVNEYHAKPSEIATKGYMCMLTFASQLKKHGQRFDLFMDEKNINTMFGKLVFDEVKDRKKTLYFVNKNAVMMKLSPTGAVKCDD